MEVAPLDIGWEGPHMIAIDLAGENFYSWMLEYPEACHRLLDKITSFDLFGYRVAPEVAAKNFGGKTLLWGNINPMLMLNGSKEEVKAAARKCLEALAPCGGLLLGDGANVCPGTPLENLAALTEAAEAYGLPAGYVKK